MQANAFSESGLARDYTALVEPALMFRQQDSVSGNRKSALWILSASRFRLLQRLQD